MIFATVGTHHQPFTRLLDALGALDRTDVVVQCGHSPAPAGVSSAVPFMSFAEIETNMRTAEAVVTHAGVGSILLALRCGHTPIVVPRLCRLGEHVDDHQSDLTSALRDRGEVIVVDEVERLGAALMPPPPRRPATALPEGELHRAVRAALLG